MNIFYLDHDPVLAASYHCDKRAEHNIKMIAGVDALLLLAKTHGWEMPE